MPSTAVVGNYSRSRGFRTLFYLILLAILLVVMPVLFANHGRNLLTLAKVLKVNLDVIEITFGKRPSKVSVPPVEPAPRQAAWPWMDIAVAAQSPFEYPKGAEESCDTIGAGAQEKPILVTSGVYGWECSVLKEIGSGSLFVQIRMSRDAAFSSFRIKFNIGPEGITEALSDEAARMMTSGIKPLIFNDALLANFKRKLASHADFYFVLGYYPVSFKREFGSTERYNLIIFNRQPRVAGLPRYCCIVGSQ